MAIVHSRRIMHWGGHDKTFDDFLGYEMPVNPGVGMAYVVTAKHWLEIHGFAMVDASDVLK